MTGRLLAVEQLETAEDPEAHLAHGTGGWLQPDHTSGWRRATTLRPPRATIRVCRVQAGCHTCMVEGLRGADAADDHGHRCTGGGVHGGSSGWWSCRTAGPDRAARAPVAALDYSADPQSPIVRLRREFVREETGLGTAGRMPRATPRPPRVGRVAPDFRCVNGRQTADPLSPPCDTSAAPGDNGGATYAGVTEEEIRIVVLALHDRTSRRADTAIVRSPRETIVDLAKPPASEPRIPRVFGAARFSAVLQRALPDVRAVPALLRALRQPVGDDEQTNAAAHGVRRHRSVRELHARLLVGKRRVPRAAGGAALAWPRAGGARCQPGYARTRPAGCSGCGRHASGTPTSWRPMCARRWWAAGIAGRARTSGQAASLCGLASKSTPGRRTWNALALEVCDRLKACGAAVELAWFDRDPVGAERLELRRACRPVRSGHDSSQGRDDDRVARLPDRLLRGVVALHRLQARVGRGRRRHVRPQVVGERRRLRRRVRRPRRADLAPYVRAAASRASVRPRPARRSIRRPPIAELFWECGMYDQLHQLFTAIQLAGPDLTPESLAVGMQSLPRLVSPDPLLPACWYLPDDGSCWKDATVMRWDRNGVAKPVLRRPTRASAAGVRLRADAATYRAPGRRATSRRSSRRPMPCDHSTAQSPDRVCSSAASSDDRGGRRLARGRRRAVPARRRSGGCAVEYDPIDIARRRHHRPTYPGIETGYNLYAQHRPEPPDCRTVLASSCDVVEFRADDGVHTAGHGPEPPHRGPLGRPRRGV